MKPEVVVVKSFNFNISTKNILELTASAELHSEHPLGKSIISNFKFTTKTALEDSKEFGRGVKVIVENNKILQ